MTTKIQWTQDTWNPLAGCFIVSPGCKNCYAMRDAHRLAHNPNSKVAAKYAGTTKLVKGKPVWTGRIGIAADTAFLKPLRIRKPTMFFVNSMSDLFHENVPDEVIDRIFAVMALCPQHTFQVLTKRSARMREYLAKRSGNWAVSWTRAVDFDRRPIHHRPDEYGRLLMRNYGPFPLPNVWLGVSVEDQTRADERIPDLLATPAAIRFISAEPLLGPVDLTCVPRPAGWPASVDNLADGIDALRYRGKATGGASLASSPSTAASATPCLDWVIVGGESGKGARPMHPDWARSIRDQCAAAGVPFFFKQWGEWAPNIGAVDGWALGDDPEISRFDHREWEDGQWGETFRPMSCDFSDGNYDEAQCVSRIGTKRAGRLLDGVEHNAMPQSLSHPTLS